MQLALYGKLHFIAHVRVFQGARRDERKMLERDPKVFKLLLDDMSRIWKYAYLRKPIEGINTNL